ncbi:sugar phosphate isomerase/epimerase [Caldicoprobacter algeriensis]|uniref:sugar phosphate isomerase/epimerase family protein n=1 Tax=Caldicoprobacter algeriensis TaxID=699281 RepID=UPI00207A0089|nr:sugar phosphate isomerase/epimerase family protein [Caldicoprobacter algeriensis]MCM8901793.1 sugar phosphate isomerase/epimerase [Caldicoprobacter algeriensis]
MKIGVCTGVENIKKMEDIGFDYIEPSVVSIAKMNDEEFNAAMNLVDGSNIKCEAFNVLFPGNIRLTGSEVDEGGIKDYLERAFARVSRLGAKVIVFGSGGARKIPDGWSREEAWKQLVRIARIAGDVAAEYGLTIAMEPLNTSETNILNSVEEGLRFVTDVGHTHVKLLADFYHMRRENEDMDVLVKAGSIIAHLHIANSNGRVCPLDRSEDVYDAFFQKLKEVGYQGRISIEAGIKDVDRDAPVGLNLLRELSK